MLLDSRLSSDSGWLSDSRWLRGPLLLSSLLHAGALMTLVLGISLLPLADNAQAVLPRSPGLLYRHALSASPVQLVSLQADASGIAWNDDTGTLFAVRNQEPLVSELDRDGNSLRDITLRGFLDVEGISWLDGSRFAVVEERDCSIWLLDMPPGATTVDKPARPLFALPGLNEGLGNLGCEDLAWNPQEQVFYLVKEKSPAMLLRISGVSLAAGNQPDDGIVVQEMPGRMQPGLFGSDMSGLHFDRQSGELLVLSDESRRITGVGTGRGQVALADAFELGWWRNGLTTPVPQPEGVTMDRDGTLYVLSEPDLLYRFTR